MATIVHFGFDQNGIVSTLASNGYEVNHCGISIPKLDDALHRGESNAVAVEEFASLIGEEIVPTIRSLSSLPVILFKGDTRTYDPSLFDLVIAQHTPTNDWLEKVAGLIERSRAIRRETTSAGKRLRSLMQESAALAEATVALRFESQHARARRKGIRIEPIQIGCTLIVDDYAPWREKVRSMLCDQAVVQSISETADGIEAVQIARELKPDLILLDLHLPRLNGIEVAKQIGELAPEAAILVVSTSKDADVAREALNTGVKGYVLKTDAGIELWPAIKSVLQKKRYLSRGVHLTD